MKRKRTLSGIRAALDYKSLNIFGDIVGNFHGESIPTVEDFNSYLQSYDSCDNLENLASQSQSQSQSQSGAISNKASEKSSNDRVKRGRKPKKRVGEDEANQNQNQHSEEISVQINPGSGSSNGNVSGAETHPSVLQPPPVVIGSIGHFFQRFCEKYPTGTSQYDSFVKLARVILFFVVFYFIWFANNL